MMAQQRGRTIDVETYGRVERASNHIAELLHELCNEPSLGLYFVQDNIRASVPRYVDIRKRMKKEREGIESCTYGVEFSLSVVKGLQGFTTFGAVLDRVRAATDTADRIWQRRQEERKAPRHTTTTTAATAAQQPQQQTEAETTAAEAPTASQPQPPSSPQKAAAAVAPEATSTPPPPAADEWGLRPKQF